MSLRSVRRIPLALVTSIALSAGAMSGESAVDPDSTDPAALQRAAGTTSSSKEPGETRRSAARRTAADDDDWKRGPRGFATYYSRMLDGRRTASGSTFDNDAMVAAHPTDPFGTLVRVTNLTNGRSVVVRVVDRGPARSARAKGNIIDLSRAAAAHLGFIQSGRARVRLDYREPAETNDHDDDDDDDDDVVAATGGR